MRAFLVMAGLVVAAAILFPVFAVQRERAKDRSCLSDMKQCELGLLQYCQDYDERLPAKKWMDSTLPYIKNDAAFRCLEAERQDSYAYGRAFELDLLGKGVRQVPSHESTALVFDSQVLHRNATARAVSGLASPGRHHDGNNIGFVDGHVKWLSDREVKRPGPNR